MERQATALIGRCYAGLDAAGLREQVLRRLRRMLTVDAAFFATVDPMTLLFTSAAADEPLAAAQLLFLENEFGREDVNKFARWPSPPTRSPRSTGPPAAGGPPVPATARSWAPSASATSCARPLPPRPGAGGCCACTGRTPRTASMPGRST